MSTRQLIFVGCKILGMYLIIVSLASFPLMIAFWKDQFDHPGGTMQEMLFSMSSRQMFAVPFTFLAGLVLFFKTGWIARMIPVPEPDETLTSQTKDLPWGIALVACIYLLLTDLPRVVLGIGSWLAKQISNEVATEDDNLQRIASIEVPVKSVSCVVALFFAYLCLRAMYGNQPFSWWGSDADATEEE